VHFFHAAIASSNGAAAFWSDRTPSANEWGSSLLNYARTMEGKPTATVATVNLTWLLMTHVAAHGTRRVVMKMDVEGAEYTVLPGAVESICRTVDVLLIERHDRFFDPAWHSARKGYASQQMKTRRVRDLDDALRLMKNESCARNRNVRPAC
jgi:FkbM family methyltransferase